MSSSKRASPFVSNLPCCSDRQGVHAHRAAPLFLDRVLEIVEDRYDLGSILITSQLPLENWHNIIGDPTIADAILERFSASRASLHNAHRIELKGESLRKTGDQTD